jgi:ornithine carbamoyltransferase
VLHCLLAHRGGEIMEEFLEKNEKFISGQSENRMYAHMTIMNSIIP